MCNYCDIKQKDKIANDNITHSFSDIEKAKTLVSEEGDIIGAIKATEGWFDLDRSHKTFIYHEDLKNLFFGKAFKKMPIKYRKHLLRKFNHKTHFLEGVSRAKALEYYYLSPDFTLDGKIIRNISDRNIIPTIPMRAYWHAIDEIVVEFYDKRNIAY